MTEHSRMSLGDPYPQFSIHPDFQIPVGNYAQNRKWNEALKGGRPDLKATVRFDEAAILNDCPFPCKVAPDFTGQYAYFGVAYAREVEKQALREWASRFPVSQILTLYGKPV